MISPAAEAHFDQLWKLFDKQILSAGGTMFLVDPFREYFSRSFVTNLTESEASQRLHERMKKWGAIEQHEHPTEVIDSFTLPDGVVIERKGFENPEVERARLFILSAFYNLMCLAAKKRTIEELVFRASRKITTTGSKEEQGAFLKLIGVSNSFLLAEWAHDLVLRAISNGDHQFFKDLGKKLTENTSEKHFLVARQWLGTILLWYLGGKDMKRRDFLHLLKRKAISPESLEELSFNSQLRKLRLIK